jgi:glycosyltransferase involved in cell wall biosynthesis
MHVKLGLENNVAKNLRALLHFFWRRIPPRFRPYIAIEPLRLALPKARNVIPSDGSPVYVVGFFTAPTGLGQGARLFYREMKERGVAVYAVDITSLLRVEPIPTLFCGAELPIHALPHHAGAGTVVVHANPPAFMVALWRIRKLLPGKRVVAYWAWELEDIPHPWTRCLEYLDEVLAPSVFVADAVRKHTRKPVHVHPHAALPVAPGRKAKERPFTVLHCFDCGSGFYRKNPLAVVTAFKEAFGDSPEAQLILKANDTNRCPEGWQQLLDAVNSANVRFLPYRLDELGMADLYAQADVYISLHRSEGYGLTIQEAMQYGLPVIATGYSGNTEFMRGEQCFSVPYTLAPVHDPQGSYAVPDAVWAEPDVGTAANMLRGLYSTYEEK